MRNYISNPKECDNCKYRQVCFTENLRKSNIKRRPWQEFQETGRNRVGSIEYNEMMIRRQIVCEGNFALQKRCHNLRFTRFRGIENVLAQCLLSSSALNLKRLVKYGNIPKMPDIKLENTALISGIFVLCEAYIFKFNNKSGI